MIFVSYEHDLFYPFWAIDNGEAHKKVIGGRDKLFTD